MPRSLNRDLFNSAALNTFASDPGAAGEDGKPRRSEFWDSILNKVAERQKSLAHERKAMADEMATLRLQCTLTGACPLAYISGRLVRVGDEVRGFSVVRIDERSVLLRKSIFTRPLAMP